MLRDHTAGTAVYYTAMVLLFLRQKYINVDSIQVDLFTFFKRKENWMRIEHCDLNVGSVVYIDVKGGKCDRVLLSSSAKD